MLGLAIGAMLRAVPTLGPSRSRSFVASDVSLAEEDDDAPSRPGCPTPVETQLEPLKALAPSWSDETSPAYEPAALDWLTKLLEGLLDAFRLPTPYLYPTPEGRARAEWSAPHWEVIATIDLATRSADVLAARVDSDEIHELPVALTEPGAESALGRFLVDHVLAQQVPMGPPRSRRHPLGRHQGTN